jgi:hypothetical protein
MKRKTHRFLFTQISQQIAIQKDYHKHNCCLPIAIQKLRRWNYYLNGITTYKYNQDPQSYFSYSRCTLQKDSIFPFFSFLVVDLLRQYNRNEILSLATLQITFNPSLCHTTYREKKGSIFNAHPTLAIIICSISSDRNLLSLVVPLPALSSLARLSYGRLGEPEPGKSRNSKIWITATQLQLPISVG